MPVEGQKGAGVEGGHLFQKSVEKVKQEHIARNNKKTTLFAQRGISLSLG